MHGLHSASHGGVCPFLLLEPQSMNCIVGDRWAGESTGGSDNTFLCDVNADRAHPAPSAFNLLCPAISKASAC